MGRRKSRETKTCFNHLPHSSRVKGWTFSIRTSPCVANLTWAITVRVFMGYLQIRLATGLSALGRESQNSLNPLPSKNAKPHPSTWWPVRPPRSRKPRNEKQKSVGVFACGNKPGQGYDGQAGRKHSPLWHGFSWDVGHLGPMHPPIIDILRICHFYSK